MHPGGTSGAGLNPPSVARIKQLRQLDLLHSLLLLHFRAGGGGEDSLARLLLPSVHIFWAGFPVGRSPLAPSPNSSAVLHLLSCRQRLRGGTGAEHGELDGLSLSREEIETDHRITAPPAPLSTPTPPFHCSISISLPSGMPTKVSLSQIIISRMRQSAHLDALTGGEPRQKGFISCDKKISR